MFSFQADKNNRGGGGASYDLVTISTLLYGFFCVGINIRMLLSPTYEGGLGLIDARRTDENIQRRSICLKF